MILTASSFITDHLIGINIQTLFMTSQPCYIVSEFGVVYIFPVDSLGYSLSNGIKYKNCVVDSIYVM